MNMLDTTLGPAQFGIALKRLIRTRFGASDIKVIVGSSVYLGQRRPPSQQWVEVRAGTYGNSLPSQLFQVALKMVYPDATHATGNIHTGRIAMSGAQWIELEKLLDNLPV